MAKIQPNQSSPAKPIPSLQPSPLLSTHDDYQSETWKPSMGSYNGSLMPSQPANRSWANSDLTSTTAHYTPKDTSQSHPTSKSFIRTGSSLSNSSWIKLVKFISSRLTHVCELVQTLPNNHAFCDASGTRGADVFWFGATFPLQPVVWFVSGHKPSSHSTGKRKIINVLELATALLHWLVLKEIVPHETLRHRSASMWIDNTSAVAWAYKLWSSNPAATGLLRAPSIRLRLHEAAPLAPTHIPGHLNCITDFASREHLLTLPLS